MFFSSCHKGVFLYSMEDPRDIELFSEEPKKQINQQPNKPVVHDPSPVVYDPSPLVHDPSPVVQHYPKLASEELINSNEWVELSKLSSLDHQHSVEINNPINDIDVLDGSSIQEDAVALDPQEIDKVDNVSTADLSYSSRALLASVELNPEEPVDTHVLGLPISNIDGEKKDRLSDPDLRSKNLIAPKKPFIPRPLDILFVVDTSESMHYHLRTFKKKFAHFLKYFSDLDWRLAITNADHGESGFFLFNIGAFKGEIMRLEEDGSTLKKRHLEPNIDNYEGIFLDSIYRHRLGEYIKSGNDGNEDVGYCELAPYCQSPQEQPLKALKAALTKNPQFFRKEADLVSIMISNSRERADNPESATQATEVLELFSTIHGDKKRFEVYGIILTDEDTACLEENKSNQLFFPEGATSKNILDLSQLTGGQVFSLCSPHYQPLAQIIFESFGEAPH